MNETDGGKERDVGLLRLEVWVLVQLQGAHDSWELAVRLGRQREHRRWRDVKWQVKGAFVRSGCDGERNPSTTYIGLDSARMGAQIVQAFRSCRWYGGAESTPRSPSPPT